MTESATALTTPTIRPAIAPPERLKLHCDVLTEPEADRVGPGTVIVGSGLVIVGLGKSTVGPATGLEVIDAVPRLEVVDAVPGLEIVDAVLRLEVVDAIPGLEVVDVPGLDIAAVPGVDVTGAVLGLEVVEVVSRSEVGDAPLREVGPPGLPSQSAISRTGMKPALAISSLDKSQLARHDRRMIEFDAFTLCP